MYIENQTMDIIHEFTLGYDMLFRGCMVISVGYDGVTRQN